MADRHGGSGVYCFTSNNLGSRTSRSRLQCIALYITSKDVGSVQNPIWMTDGYKMDLVYSVY